MTDKAKAPAKSTGPTIEDALRKRCANPDAMRAGINDANGEIRIVFGGVNGHPRQSLLVKGNAVQIESD